MELFDIVDKDRNPLGYTKERHEELLDNEYNVGVELWNFYNKRLLLTQRAPNKSHPGEWEVPGGCSQTKETSDDTIKREIMEEIGYNLNNNYKLIGSSLYKQHYVDLFKSNIDIDINKCVLQENEVSGIRYVTRDEFLELNKENLDKEKKIEKNSLTNHINIYDYPLLLYQHL